jgi:hypothetical protein
MKAHRAMTNEAREFLESPVRKPHLETSMSVVSKFLIGVAAIFVAIQFVRPPINHPPVTAELQVPAPVAQILRNSCYNCHSNETRLSWFDQVAPARWLVAYDVKTARSHVNFSELGKLPPAAQRGTLYEAVNQIRLGAMPLPRYRHAHPSSVITPQQLDVLEQYLQPFAPLSPVPAQTAETQTAETGAQYHQWAASSHAERTVQSSPQPAPNGLTFFPDYKNWKTISSTDRGDNHTLRFILPGCSHRTPAASDLFNQQAALQSTLPVPALEWKVISSSVDRQHGTMSTLIGNDIAVTSARSADSSYPKALRWL